MSPPPSLYTFVSEDSIIAIQQCNIIFMLATSIHVNSLLFFTHQLVGISTQTPG